MDDMDTPEQDQYLRQKSRDLLSLLKAEKPTAPPPSVSPAPPTVPTVTYPQPNSVTGYPMSFVPQPIPPQFVQYGHPMPSHLPMQHQLGHSQPPYFNNHPFQPIPVQMPVPAPISPFHVAPQPTSHSAEVLGAMSQNLKDMLNIRN
ncbi:hypothetical protein BC829DRAFT_398326 [Chytridium lagenaria]|nr:hypothetical protein BC829DRAFT_398326 [Chytridium lagenaria]